jgi:hypothetical protein
MNRLRKEQLREYIDKLDAEEHAQIFEVIKRHTTEYTRTQTGALVSSDTLPDACLLEMERMVTFYRDQHKRMDADAQERKQYTVSQTR